MCYNKDHAKADKPHSKQQSVCYNKDHAKVGKALTSLGGTKHSDFQDLTRAPPEVAAWGDPPKLFADSPIVQGDVRSTGIHFEYVHGNAQ